MTQKYSQSHFFYSDSESETQWGTPSSSVNLKSTVFLLFFRVFFDTLVSFSVEKKNSFDLGKECRGKGRKRDENGGGEISPHVVFLVVGLYISFYMYHDECQHDEISTVFYSVENKLPTFLFKPCWSRSTYTEIRINLDIDRPRDIKYKLNILK